MEGKKRNYKKRSRAYWNSRKPRDHALKARAAYDQKVLQRALQDLQPQPQPQPKSEAVKLTGIAALTILGVVTLIGIFFGTQGLYMLGSCVLLALGVLAVFLTEC